MKILGFDPDNPFSLFLILILLLAASGAFDSKAAKAEDSQEAGVGTSDDKNVALRPAWKTRSSHPLLQRRKVSWSSPARAPRLRRMQIRRDLAVSLPKIMPLGR